MIGDNSLQESVVPDRLVQMFCIRSTAIGRCGRKFYLKALGSHLFNRAG